MTRCHLLKALWRQLVVVIVPLVLLPLPLLQPEDQRAGCGYVLLLMSVLWCTEAIPLAVTGLLPALLFPLFGILSSTQLAAEYTKNMILLQIGSITMAIAFEKCNLHRRVALSILKVVGTEPRWLMLGFMLATWFLSMWISNTSTTALMLPMVDSVIMELEKPSIPYVTSNTGDNNTEVDQIIPMEMTGTHSNDEINGEPHLTLFKSLTSEDLTSTSLKAINPQEDFPPVKTAHTELAKVLVLSVAYSANVGGMATLTGTGPNIILKGFADDLWMENIGTLSPVNYTSWVVVGMPLACLLLVLSWLVLQAIFLGCRHKRRAYAENTSERKLAVKLLINQEYSKLKPFSFAEGAVTLLFIAMVLLWFFLNPDFLRGWATFFLPKYIGSAVPAILMAVLTYVIPFSAPWKGLTWTKDGRVDTLMDWDTYNTKMPWNILLILGGGFALAKGVQVSGLGPWLGQVLTGGSYLPGWVMVVCASLLASAVTEFNSNAASCSLLMPIVSNMSERMGYSPLYLMFPVAFSCSFSFMLPVATAPNTLAYATGRLAIIDMVKTGVVMNILATLCVTMVTQSWGMSYFSLGVAPWVHNNRTITGL